jgi:serine/threonine protein kinase
LVATICDGLEVAHAASIVHRDIEPSNILLPRDAPDAPRIVDFGIAALTGASDPRLTRKGAVVGTPRTWLPSS